MPCILLCPRFFLSFCLSAETQLLDDSSVSLDVNLLKVVQELTTLRDQAKKGLSGEPVSLLDFPYFAKISCFFSGCKYSAMMQ